MQIHARLPYLMAFLAAAAAPQRSQGTLAAGYQATPLPYPGSAQICSLPGGDLLAFDGAELTRHAADGTWLQSLLSFSPPVFTGLLAADVTGSYCLLGESSFGSLHRIDLASGQDHPIATVVNNYAATQEPAGTWLLSAAQCGWSCGNDLVRLDAQSGATQTLGHLSGPSGPLVADAAGNLYYGQQPDGFSPPPGASRVALFLAASLSGAAPLGDADGLDYSVGWDGVSALALDPSNQRLYLAENHPASGANRLYEASWTKSLSSLIVDGPGGMWLSGLELDDGHAPAEFLPYQPASGGRLRYLSTDFFSQWQRVELAPARPQIALAGPGTGGEGALDLSLAGGPPGGLALWLYAPAGALQPAESAVALSGWPALFSPLDLAQASFFPLAFALDAQGGNVWHAQVHGLTPGSLALQALALTGSAGGAGTSNALVL